MDVYFRLISGDVNVLKQINNLNRIDFGETLLTISVHDKDMKPNLIKALIDAGADVNAPNSSNSTALIDSCLFDREELIPILIKAGDNINIKNADGNTALYYAVESNINSVRLVPKLCLGTRHLKLLLLGHGKRELVRQGFPSRASLPLS